MPMIPKLSCALACALMTTVPLAQLPASALADTTKPQAAATRTATAKVSQHFPWTCRAKTMQAQKTSPEKGLQGLWISSHDPARMLDIREDRFSLQGTGRNLKGSVAQEGPELVFTLEDKTSCRVMWQLLGDGRLAVNSGLDLMHRQGEPAIPATTVRTFGNSECRFTVAIPSVLPMEETEDGVRIMSVERDAAMQILSGTTDKSCRDFARAIATALGSTDLKAVDNETNAYTFTATVRGIPVMQYIAMEGRQYLHISLMGQYNKLVAYLKNVKIADSTGADQGDRQ